MSTTLLGQLIEYIDYIITLENREVMHALFSSIVDVYLFVLILLERQTYVQKNTLHTIIHLQ